MSGSVCALGHPLSGLQYVCPICGLGRLPETPPASGTVGVPAAAPPAPTPEVAPASQFDDTSPAAPATGWSAPAPSAVPPPPPPPGAQWSSYPISAYGAPPRSSKRGIIIGSVAAVIVLAVASSVVYITHKPKPTATGVVQADGTTIVNSRGIRITTPVGWTVVPTTTGDLAKAGQSLAASNPQLGNALRALQSRDLQNALRLFAFGSTGSDGFTANANVLVSSSVLPLDNVVASNSTELTSTGALHIEESPVTTNSDAAELTFQQPLTLPTGRSITLNVQQVYEKNGNELGILTLETTAATDPGFSTMISSFQLT